MLLVSFVCFFSLILHTRSSFQEQIPVKVAITFDLEENIAFPPQKTDKLLWHVAVLQQEESELKFLCSGTILGHSYVITASSCLVNVKSSEIRIVAGLTVLRNSNDVLENPHSVYTVAEKYNLDDSDKNGLVALKLQNKANFQVPQLTTLGTSDEFSKRCFTLGWGLQHNSAVASRCLKTSFQDSIVSIKDEIKLSKEYLQKVADYRNSMLVAGLFALKMSRLHPASLVPTLQQITSKLSQNITCSTEGLARLNVVRLSTLHPYKCACRDVNRLCLYSVGAFDDIAKQVDVGSPVYCNLKEPKDNSRSLLKRSSTFFLAGIITEKKVEKLRMPKCGSSMNMITATYASSLTDFIMGMMLKNN